MSRDTDPGREIARLALSSKAVHDSHLLTEIVGYCWEQMQWRRGDAELLAMLDTMRADIEEGSR